MALQLIAAFLGSLGFCLVFQLRRKYLFPAALGGLLCWGVYLLFNDAASSVFLPALAASAFAALYAEVLARVMKAPVTLFFISAVIPLIPGGNLFNAMRSAVRSEWETASMHGSMTLQYAVGIALGICLVWALSAMVQSVLALRHKKTGI